MVTKTTGTKIASDGFMERVFEASLADLQNDEVAFSKFKLIVEDIQGILCPFSRLTENLKNFKRRWAKNFLSFLGCFNIVQLMISISYHKCFVCFRFFKCKLTDFI